MRTILTGAWVTAVTALVVYGMFRLDVESPWVVLAALEAIGLLCLPAVWWDRKRTPAVIRLTFALVLTPLLLLVFGAPICYVHEKLGFREFPGILLGVVPAAVAGLGLYRLFRPLPVTQADAQSKVEFMEIRKSEREDSAVARYVDDPSARITCAHLIPVESALQAACVYVAPVSQAVYRGNGANRFEMELKPRTITARAMLNFLELQAAIPLAPSVSFKLPTDDEYYERIQKPGPMLFCDACDSSIRFAEQADIQFPA